MQDKDSIVLQLIDMLNDALRLEHASKVQYLTHAEHIKGLDAEKLVERLHEIANDEEGHQTTLRKLIDNYLGGEPTMEMAATEAAYDVKAILEVNLQQEQDSIHLYRKIYHYILQNKSNLLYTFETLEQAIRYIIINEQEHIVELLLLLNRKGDEIR